MIDVGDIKTSFTAVSTIFPYKMSIDNIDPRTGQIKSPKAVVANAPFPVFRPSDAVLIIYAQISIQNYYKRYPRCGA